MKYVKNVLEYLEASAERLPDKTALRDGKVSFSFSELLELSRRIGTATSALAGVPNKPVAVLCDREALSVAALLGVLQSGCFYVPLERRMPRKRLAAILERLRPAALLRLEADDWADELGLPALTMEEAAGTEPEPELLLSRKAAVLDADPAYMIYTSGSTGVPKGIVITHRGLIDFTEWLTQSCGLTGYDALADQAPLYFDTSVKNIYPGLKLGATVHLLEKKLFSFPLLLIRYLNEHKITALIWSTSAFQLVADSGVFERERPESVRLVAVGGETLRARHLNIWKRALPDALYYNHYGPTEVTVDCAWYKIDRDFADGETVPIGRACENMELLLLNENGLPAAPGETGEICVRGLGLAPGYYDEWEKTSAAFVQNPLNPHYPDRLYRTGDLGTMDGDGNITFLSRRDGQIKHMGHRIELGEIETAVCALDGIGQAICLFDEKADKILCVYEGALDGSEMILALRSMLPKIMLPNICRRVPALPRNANGKVDRARLREEYINEA